MPRHVIRPLLVFEKFLAHEKHRNARRCQNESCGDARAAARPPGVRIGGVGDAWYTIHPAGIIRALWSHYEIVILDALHTPPQILKVPGRELFTQGRHRELIVICTGRECQRLPNGFP